MILVKLVIILIILIGVFIVVIDGDRFRNYQGKSAHLLAQEVLAEVSGNVIFPLYSITFRMTILTCCNIYCMFCYVVDS